MRTRSGKDYADGPPEARATAAFTPAPTGPKVSTNSQTRRKQRRGGQTDPVPQLTPAVPAQSAPLPTIAPPIDTASPEPDKGIGLLRQQEHPAVVPITKVEKEESPTPMPRGRRAEMAQRRHIGRRPQERVQILFHDGESEVVDLTKDESDHDEVRSLRSKRRRIDTDDGEVQDTMARRSGPMGEHFAHTRLSQFDSNSRDVGSAQRVSSNAGVEVVDLTEDDEPSYKAIRKSQPAKPSSSRDSGTLAGQQHFNSLGPINPGSQRHHEHAQHPLTQQPSSSELVQKHDNYDRVKEQRPHVESNQHAEIKPHHNLPPRPSSPTEPLRTSHGQQMLSADGNAEISMRRLQHLESSGMQYTYAGQAPMLSPWSQAIQHSKLIMFTLAAARVALENSKNGRNLFPKYDMDVGERFTYPVTRSYYLGAMGRLDKASESELDREESNDRMEVDSFSRSSLPMGAAEFNIVTKHTASHADTTFRPFQPLKVRKEEEYVFKLGKYKGFPFRSVPRKYIETIYEKENLKDKLEQDPPLRDALFRYRPNDERLQRAA